MASVDRIERDRLTGDLLRRGRVRERVAGLLRGMPDVSRLVLTGSSPRNGYEPAASRPVGDPSFPISHSGGVAHVETGSPEIDLALPMGNLALVRTAEVVVLVN